MYWNNYLLFKGLCNLTIIIIIRNLKNLRDFIFYISFKYIHQIYLTVIYDVVLHYNRHVNHVQSVMVKIIIQILKHTYA